MPRGKKPEQEQDVQVEQAGAKPDELPHGHAGYPDLTDRTADEDIATRVKHAGLEPEEKR